MIKKTLALTAVMTVLSAPAFAQSMGDFRMDAMQANAFEIQSSQIAINKSRNPQVLRFAREAIRDHRAANVALAGGESNYAAVRGNEGHGRCRWRGGRHSEWRSHRGRRGHWFGRSSRCGDR
jgi:hypothetical protein